jgi:hypothetical protein
MVFLLVVRIVDGRSLLLKQLTHIYRLEEYIGSLILLKGASVGANFLRKQLKRGAQSLSWVIFFPFFYVVADGHDSRNKTQNQADLIFDSAFLVMAVDVLSAVNDITRSCTALAT